MAPKERALRCFSISEGGRADKHFYVAGKTIEDCCVLLAHAQGVKRPHDNPYSAAHLTTYGSGWGTTTKGKLEVKRGVYRVTGSLWLRDQSKTTIEFIEPPAHVPGHVPNATPTAAAAAQLVPENYGRVESGISKQMKIDEWTFNSPHEKDHAKFRATIYLVRGGARFHGRVVDRETAFSFVAESEVFEKIVDTDIDRLRTLVAQAFAVHDLGQRGIVWEDWFEVEVIPHEVSGYLKGKEWGAGLSVEYRPIKRGVHPRTGEELTISTDWHGKVTAFPKPKSATPPKKSLVDEENDLDEYDTRDRRDAHQYAYIPATPENRAALETICAALANARTKIELLLAQGSIQKSLASIPTINLLEAK